MNHLSMLMHDFPFMVEITAIAFGAMFGSFINVVVYRMPKMMEEQFQADVREVKGITGQSERVLSLAYPPSSCPHCNYLIRWYENIPVISWLFLRGKCSNCGENISARYPIVEAICAALIFVNVSNLGFGYDYLLISFATLCGVAIALIDWDEQIIEPKLCGMLLWIGLIGSIVREDITPTQSILGVCVGFGILWAIKSFYTLVFKKDALGGGDLQLLGAIGAWVGPSDVGTVLTLAFFYVIPARKIKKKDVVPYGPGLIAGMWVMLMFSNYVPAWARLTF